MHQYELFYFSSFHFVVLNVCEFQQLFADVKPMGSRVIFALDESSKFPKLFMGAVVPLFAFFVELHKFFETFFVSLDLFLQELKFVGYVLIHFCICI